ncbi:MAG: flagellar hook-length control protein FliK [Ignavibacteriales bacterium]|nr:flagellar hook-length control protein FliK [Ignavibacteriales bacterium]
MTTSSVAVDSGLALQSNQPLPTGQTVLDDRRTDNRTAGMRGQEIAVAVPSRPGMLSQAGQAANAPIEVVRSSAPRSTTAANEKKGSIIEALKADNPETQKLNIRSIEVLEEKTAAMGNRATSVPAAASAQAKQGETILSEFPAANPAAIRKNEAQSAGVTGTMVMRSENGTTELRAIGSTPTLKGTTHLEVLTRLNESPEQRTKPAVSSTPAASQQVKDPFVHEALNTENRSQKNAGGVQTEPVEVMKAAAADQPAEAPRGGNLDTRQNDGKQNPKQSQVITSKDDMRPAAKAPDPSPQPEAKTATSIAKPVSTSPQGTQPGGTIAPTADTVNKAASSSDESSPTVKKHTPAQSTDATPTTASAKPVSASPQATLSGDSISAAAHAVKQAATSREEIHTAAKASEPAANSEIKTATASARPVDSVTPPSQGTPSVDTITAAAHSVRQQIPVITSEARTERTTLATMKSLPDVIVQEVSKAASSLTKETATEIRITLKPESLGEMVVKVSMEDGRVKAEIEVGSASVRAIVEANIPALRDTLISRGVDIQKIDVTTEGDSGSRHASSQQEPRQKGRQDNGVFTSAEQYSAERNMGYNTIELII